jgi:hypothetical protein
VDLSKGVILNTSSSKKSATGLETIYLSNWFSPLHLFPKGGALEFKGVNPDKIKETFKDKAVQFYLYADAEIIQKVVTISGLVSGGMPDDPYGLFHSTLMSGLEQATDAAIVELDRPAQAVVGKPFYYVQVIIPDFNPDMVTPTNVPGIRWFWWEVTLTKQEGKKLITT